MRVAINVLAVLLVFFGIVWFLQGINVLPGSFMTGQIKWAIYGGVAVLVGLLVLLMNWRRSKQGTRI
ncbi:MAG: hypothetical protein C5B57_00540 [Blastocatellia bacterium]|nr:MAG: hypothetical protein C5B57_00540 [Blastocatellia bacterium]